VAGPVPTSIRNSTRAIPAELLACTLYMDAALTHLRGAGAEVKSEDVARLSPLGHEHINVLGRYSFALANRIAQGELRPLRHPDDRDDPAISAA